MADIIIDTNVLIVANEQGKNISFDCFEACSKFIAQAFQNTILLDKQGDIREEYAKNIKMALSPIGSRYYLNMVNQLYNEKKVRQIELKQKNGTYIDFPTSPALEKFDLSDRKFAALAKKTNIPVTNATDSDWVIYKQPLLKNGIKVNFLCGENLKG